LKVDPKLHFLSTEIGISFFGLSAQLELFIVLCHFSQWFMEINLLCWIQ